MRFRHVSLSIGVLVLLSVEAREFREFKPIGAPVAAPKGATPVKEVQPVSPSAVQEGVKDLFAAWNSGDLSDKLGNDLYDKDRLLDSIGEKVPRDAKVHVLGTQNIQTLAQFEQPDTSGKGTTTLTSTVSVVVKTQVEFNDPKKGFQRVDGSNEYILRITEEVER